MRVLSVLVLVAVSIPVLVACGESERSVGDAVGSSIAGSVPVLKAIAVPKGSTIVMDGTSADLVWKRAEAVDIPLRGKGPATVSLQAAYDEGMLYLLARWRDAELSMNRFWRYLGDARWEQTHGEDGFAICWSPGAMQDEFREQSCALFCHDGKHSYPARDDGFADFWYWGAQRTRFHNQAEDQWLPFGALQRRRGDRQPPDSGNMPNVSDEYSGPAFTFLLVKPFRNPFLGWKNCQPLTRETLLTRIRSSAKPGWEIPLDVQRPMAGSRGDVRVYGRFVEGEGWVLELMRRLETGNPDDQPLGDPLVPFLFSVAVFDNSEGQDHAISDPVELRFVSNP